MRYRYSAMQKTNVSVKFYRLSGGGGGRNLFIEIKVLRCLEMLIGD